ncbi:hypothetical protein OROMI_006639 [Orobanche minor]
MVFKLKTWVSNDISSCFRMGDNIQHLWWSTSSNIGTLELLGYKEGYRVDVDLPEGTWAEAPSFYNVLIFNTGHWWWAPSKSDHVKSPMLFFEKGIPVTPPVAPDAGLDMVLRHMVSFVGNNARPSAILFFRTQSPRHFEGGEWDQGGTCPRLQPLVPQELKPWACSIVTNEQDFDKLDIVGTWAGMEKCLQMGLCRAIGVTESYSILLVLLIRVTKVAKSAFDKALAEHEDIYDAVGSEEPTERDHRVDLQQPLLIKIDSSDSH